MGFGWQSRPQRPGQAVHKGLGNPQSGDVYKILVRRPIVPGSGIFSPSPQLLSQAFRKAGSQAGHLTSRSWAVPPCCVPHRGHMPTVFSQGGGGGHPPHRTLPHNQCSVSWTSRAPPPLVQAPPSQENNGQTGSGA